MFIWFLLLLYVGDRSNQKVFVASLNKNARNCSHVDCELQCVLFHANLTNRFQIQLRPEWAPIGVERFVHLTASGFSEDVRVFRVVRNFVSQFIINPDANVQRGWHDVGPILDNPVVASNDRGTVLFATSGPDTRTM